MASYDNRRWVQVEVDKCFTAHGRNGELRRICLSTREARTHLPSVPLDAGKYRLKNYEERFAFDGTQGIVCSGQGNIDKSVGGV